MSEFGTDIIKRFPEHHIIHNPLNPLHIMNNYSIGRLFDETLTELENNIDMCFLDGVKGIFLDRFGELTGLPRGDMTDDEYRVKIQALRGGNITLDGIKGFLSTLLDLTQDQISVTNALDGCCICGVTPIPDKLHAAGPVYAQHYTRDRGIINITVPIGTDISIAEPLMPQITLPGVSVIFKEE